MLMESLVSLSPRRLQKLPRLSKVKVKRLFFFSLIVIRMPY